MLILVILDGFGYSNKRTFNAIKQAHTPHISRWINQYPYTLVHSSGSYVGLPPFYVGNSEVGHLTIGAGRIVDQPALIIHKAIADGTFFTNRHLYQALEQIKQSNTTLHIMGLLSDAGVHSTLEFLQAVIKSASNAGLQRIVVHAFLDGRDVFPQSAKRYLELLEQTVSLYDQVVLGSIHGRFYAMDRDHNWDRTERSYRILTEKTTQTYPDWRSVLADCYHCGITDEYIPPTQVSPNALLADGDSIICTNYRPDRIHQLLACFINQDKVPFITKPLNLSCIVSPVSYGIEYNTVTLFDRPYITHTLKEVLSYYQKTITTISETEKYTHVTYFFNGEKEESIKGETPIMIPSIRAKHYSMYPCMSAHAITRAVLTSVLENPSDFYLINYANADMVGHSGDFQATVKAIECLDEQLGILYHHIVERMGGTLIVTADHGKAEVMYDEKEKQAYTGHTANPVPFLVIAPQNSTAMYTLPTKLSEIAPFILQYMQIPIPDEMK